MCKVWFTVANISENTLPQSSRSEIEFQTTGRHIPNDCSFHHHKRLCSDITNLSFTSLHCSAGLGSWQICAQHCWNLPCSETRCHSSQSHLYMLKQNTFETSTGVCINTETSYCLPSLRVYSLVTQQDGLMLVIWNNLPLSSSHHYSTLLYLHAAVSFIWSQQLLRWSRNPLPFTKPKVLLPVCSKQPTSLSYCE